MRHDWRIGTRAGIGTVGLYAAVNTTGTFVSMGSTCGTVRAPVSGSFNCGSATGTGSMAINGSSHVFAFSNIAAALSGSGPAISFYGTMVPDPTLGNCPAGPPSTCMSTLWCRITDSGGRKPPTTQIEHHLVGGLG